MSPYPILIVLWLLTTGTGVALTSTMMWLTHADLVFLKDYRINGAVERLTKLAFWQELRRFLIKVFLFLIGLESLATHHQTQDFARYDFGAWFFIVCLFAVVWLLNYSTIAAFRYRRDFMRRDDIAKRKEP